MQTCRLMVALLVIAVAGCGVSKTEYDRVIAENAALRKEIDELKNGESRLAAIIRNQYSEGKFSETKTNIQKFTELYPASALVKDFAAITQRINQSEKAARDRQIEEEKERARLAKLNDTGMWTVRTFVDKFGERTNSKYATNKDRIIGTFSNSATESSPLGIEFLIESPSKVAIQLYEYNGTNPVKAYRTSEYNVALKDGKGEEWYFVATNYVDRLHLELDGGGVEEAFRKAMKNAPVTILIEERDRGGRSKYRFKFENSDTLENVFRILATNEVKTH